MKNSNLNVIMRMQIYAFFGIYPIKSDKNKRICDSVCAIFAYTAEGGEEMYPPKNRGIGYISAWLDKVGKEKPHLFSRTDAEKHLL